MGAALPNQIIDVRQLYSQRMGDRTQGIPNQSQRLTNILAHYGIPELGAHDAYNDAIMTAMAFLHMRSRL
jgi:DNA polymerase-3 subunit epsilon